MCKFDALESRIRRVDMDTKNIMIVGVGGQGTPLASKMLGYVPLYSRDMT